MQGPLAVGVTLGGMLLDVVAPRPKPRAGYAYESGEASSRAVSRTPRSRVGHEEQTGASVASVRL